MDAAAGDDVDAAARVARSVALELGSGDARVEVLHTSNNVVVCIGDLVVKVSTVKERAERDVVVASHAAGQGGPAVAPIAGPLPRGGYWVTVWPRVVQAPRSDDAVEAAMALRALHDSLRGVPVALPPLSSRLEDVQRLLHDVDATPAIPAGGRGDLLRAVDAVLPATDGTAVLHTEPHEGNRLRGSTGSIFIDFEAATVGPVEWDIAYFTHTVAARVWPEHDRRRRDLLAIGVSACVSAACWRHVTARPGDTAMRGHAEHHLDVVRSAVDRM